MPILGDLPILGKLFTHTSDLSRKTNVVVYLTPYIVRRSDDLEKLKEMLDELESVQEEYNNFIYERLEEKSGHKASRRISSGTQSASKRILHTNTEVVSGMSAIEEF